MRCTFLKRLSRNVVFSFGWMLAVCALLLVCLMVTVRFSKGPFELTATVDEIQTYHKYDIDCSAIYDLDPVEVGKSLVIRKNVVEEKDTTLVNLTSNCPRYLKSRGYGTIPVSEEERQFPLAYSMVVHKSAWMVERILRSVYSPNNLYCIHYDQKSSAEFKSAMEGLAHCLPNVFIASKLENVIYASITRLKADLNCLFDLLGSEVKWRYVINLCGQDFPLRANGELVSELRALRGSNMLETTRPPFYKTQRYAFQYKLVDANFEYHKIPIQTGVAKDPPPHNIEMFIGSAYFTLSREFVNYVINSPHAKDFLKWSEDTFSPDEHFWATLARVPGVPGEVPRSQPDVSDLMSRTRLVKWYYLEGSLYPDCTGRHVRSVCIYGAGEIRWLLENGHWFANKVDPMVDPVLIQCLEEKLQERQRRLVIN
ncbi:beta-1,3-galactosyl-O-glycosyl-glycoprotein beta-1,6-N-acetylglucosaminyltransferase 4-like [Osmerus eperlanus]|uniref:beta-1,3-galactosyl-O-glycosyl-glycoprotein beta-1,6-N-acetylglucosaminyltransferase 4-like n=1 Tax=Osmerus eperlanus TaxID=29151 RepID=UPI002E133026